jgi:hypothetical protein
MFPGTETITVIARTAGALDEYGIPTQSVTEVEVDGCLVEYDSTSEPVVIDSDPIIQSATLYVPVTTTVDECDEFIIRGDTWVKDGSVMTWNSPFRSPIQYSIVKVRRRLA